MPPDSDAGLVASLRGLEPRRPAAVPDPRPADVRLRRRSRSSSSCTWRRSASTPLTIGAILTLTLIGDTLISLWLTTRADRFGRRRVLIAGALLMAAAGVAFALTSIVPLLILAGDDRRDQPDGQRGRAVPRGRAGGAERDDLGRAADGDVRLVQPRRLRRDGGRGAGGGHRSRQALIGAGWSDIDAYRAVVVGYAALGLADGRRVRGRRARHRAARRRPAPTTGFAAGSASGGRRAIVARLSGLFALDAFAGGFVPQALMAYWFHLTFGVEPAGLGLLFFAANLLAAVSSLSAARIAGRIGLINTMVFTHLPSNVLLILVPFMPTLPLAVDLPARPLRPQPDGRPDAPVLRDGGRRSRRAIGRRGRHRDRPDDGCGDLTGALGPADRQRVVRGCAVRHRRQPQDRLRPAAVRGVPVPARRRASASPPSDRPAAGRATAVRPDASAPARHPEPPPDEQHDRDADARRRSARSNGWSAWRIVSQFAPSCTPAKTRTNVDHRKRAGRSSRRRTSASASGRRRPGS